MTAVAAPNPVYCTSKAGFHAYLEALRNRVAKVGVKVVTIKPGFVDTAMTRGKDGLFWVISADRAAEIILKKARRAGGDRLCAGPLAAGDDHHSIDSVVHLLEARDLNDGSERPSQVGRRLGHGRRRCRICLPTGRRRTALLKRSKLRDTRVFRMVLRGAGCSYGDAAFRPESVVLDLSGAEQGPGLGPRNRHRRRGARSESGSSVAH